MQFNVTEVQIKDIKPYKKNAKKHGKKQIEQVANSIKEFGFVQPIVIDKNNNIIIGHCRFEASKKLKYKEVPCLKIENLSEEQVKALRLADNKLNESEWDLDLLSLSLEEIDDFDMSVFGFDKEEIQDIENEVIEDEVPDEETETEPKAKLGQIYQLGRHKLMCGDSTIEENYNELLGSTKIDLFLSDPPYNMDYVGAGGKRTKTKIKNDKMPEEQFRQFLNKVLKNAADTLKEGATFYAFYKEMGYGTFPAAIREVGLEWRGQGSWIKNQLVLGGSKYQSMHENFIVGSKGSINTWNGGRNQVSVMEDIDFMEQEELRILVREIVDNQLEIYRANKPLKNDLHPTMKPIKLLAKMLKNSSNPDDNVLDVFGGSGSTLIACEQMNRNCFMIEYEAKYIDIIIERWETLTGSKAVLIKEAN